MWLGVVRIWIRIAVSLLLLGWMWLICYIVVGVWPSAGGLREGRSPGFPGRLFPGERQDLHAMCTYDMGSTTS